MVGSRFRITSSGNIDRKGFSEDEHIPDLLLFNPQVRFHEEEAHRSGKIILQDKASCFPATVLTHDTHELRGDFIDATAAPGNKTTHLSALLGNKGKVSALLNSLPRIFRPQTDLLGCLAIRVRAGCKAVRDVEIYGNQSRLSKRGADECRLPDDPTRRSKVRECYSYVSWLQSCCARSHSLEPWEQVCSTPRAADRGSSIALIISPNRVCSPTPSSPQNNRTPREGRSLVQFSDPTNFIFY
jgi:hypothetical protein